MIESPLQVRAFRSWHELAKWKSAWDALLLDSTNPSVFLSPQWQECWYGAYHELGELLVLLVSNTTDELVGVLPMYVARQPKPFGVARPLRTLRVVGSGSGGTCTNLGPVARADDSEAVARALATYLAEHVELWDEIDLHFYLAEDPAATSLIAALQARGYSGTPEGEPHSVVHLPGTYDEYIAGLSKKMRTEIPYEQRRIERAYTVSYHRAETHEERRASTQTLIELNDKRWHARGEPGSFSTPEKRQLAESIGAHFLDLGWLDLWELRLDGKTAAVEYGFRFGSTFFPLWVAIDTEFIKFEVGSSLRAHIINHLIEIGITHYEFMRGRETYKARWGSTAFEYRSVLLTKPGTYADRIHRAEVAQAKLKTTSRNQFFAGAAAVKKRVPEAYWVKARDTARKIAKRG